jgi:uncharacterized lipoprotein NlpE involved in copper resistance
MNNSIIASMFLLIGCSNDGDKQSADVSACSKTLLQKRELDASLAEIVVIGKWQRADPTVKMNGVEYGAIKISKIIKGAFEDNEIVMIDVAFDGGEQDDDRNKRSQCPLTKILLNEERVFYIIRDELKYRVIDHKASIEN